MVSDILMGLKINKLSPDVSEDGTLDEEPSLRFRLHPKLTDKTAGNTLNHSQTYIPKLSFTNKWKNYGDLNLLMKQFHFI